VLAAIVGLAACGGAHGQTLEYLAREHGSSSRDDKAAAVAYWQDPVSGNEWMYTAGYVTQNDGSNNPHTRLAVFRYPAAVNNTDVVSDPPPPQYDQTGVFAYYPPEAGGSWTPVGQHAATAMTVDPSGNIYVCGYTTLEENGDNGTDTNYIILKYDKDLAPVWTGSGWGGVDHARGYDGTASNPDGNDTAVSIAVADGSVLVTGTSSNGSDTDIVTLRLTGSGARAGAWPDEGTEGVGVRRHDGTAHGDDTAAEVGYQVITEGDEPGVVTFVVGTSDRNGSGLDTAVLCYDPSGDHAGAGQGWEAFLDAGAAGEDHGTGLLVNGSGGETQLFVCGYGAVDTANPPDIDYAVYRLDPILGLTSDPGWEATFDFAGGQDKAVAICAGSILGGASFVWVTGSAEYSGHPRAGTVAISTAGDQLAIVGYAYVNGGDTVANAICDSAGGCLVTGTVLRAVGDPELFVIRYVLNPPDPPSTPNADLEAAWLLMFPANASYLPDEGLAITHAADEQEAIVAGATTYSSGTSKDVSILRIEPPQ
jgi:hypothetical protein